MNWAKKDLYEALVEKQCSPFTRRITKAPPLQKFSPPKFNVYNGRLDSADHVRYYKHVMVYWIFDDVVMCRMFPANLGGSALRWFAKLPEGQIDSFKELAKQFAACFITNSRLVKGPDDLIHLRKEKIKTLREYSSRYQEIFQETDDCDLKFAISTFKYGLPWDRNLQRFD